MAFSMFQAAQSPIAIDFGTSSIKILQIAADDRPHIVAMAELAVPDAARTDPATHLDFIAEYLPGILSQGKFKGRKAVIAIPSSQTFIRHMQLTPTDGVDPEENIKAELTALTGADPNSVVVRHLTVGETARAPQKQEVICFAMGRDTVMRYVQLLQKQKITVAGVHTETRALVHAFDHLYQRKGDDQITTLYVDLGWGGMQIAIAHGSELRFARHVNIGGRELDQIIMRGMKCDMSTARAHRLGLAKPPAAASTAPAPAPTGSGQAILDAAADAESNDGGAAVAVDRRSAQLPVEFSSLITASDEIDIDLRVDASSVFDAIPEEIMQSVRYHRAMYPKRPIDRMIFLGGEARQMWLCQHIVKRLQVPAHMGDPLSRMDSDDGNVMQGIELGQPQPGWGVACGLCHAPTDL